MFLRLLILGLIGYSVYRLFKGGSSEDTKKNEVRGNVKNKPLDLNESDVADAQYEEIDEGKK